MKDTTICTPGNCNGDLEVAESEGKFYWSVKNWDGYHWSEIPESLYREIIKHESDTND
ncbi:hypothetical protein NVP1240O_57 [Vibrio phage 1.240.O._10N.261.52.F8]|nr:hypothetical protein NVP1240O_57 [Vibrio phage 1.240.O._10N.261.52.F8]